MTLSFVFICSSCSFCMIISRELKIDLPFFRTRIGYSYADRISQCVNIMGIGSDQAVAAFFIVIIVIVQCRDWNQAFYCILKLYVYAEFGDAADDSGVFFAYEFLHVLRHFQFINIALQFLSGALRF